MNTLVFNVLMGVLVAAIGIITKTLIPYIQKKKEEATAKIRQTKWAWAADIIDAVVRAVEQTVSGYLHGDEKKQLATEAINRILAQNGLSMTDDQIEALIEAAVQALPKSKEQ